MIAEWIPLPTGYMKEKLEAGDYSVWVIWDNKEDWSCQFIIYRCGTIFLKSRVVTALTQEDDTAMFEQAKIKALQTLRSWIVVDKNRAEDALRMIEE